MIGKFFKQNASTSSVPAGKRIYAIGDIHGRRDMLDALLERIRADIEGAGLSRETFAADTGAPPKPGSGPEPQLIFLGDYVDRGADSRGVIDRLLALREAHPGSVFLKGNHEAIMLDFLSDPEDLTQWLDWGGEETLASYGVDPASGFSPAELAREVSARMPAAHRAFIDGLKLYHIEGDYLFVHAGLRPGTPLKDQTEADLIWIRKRFHNAAPEERPDKVVVHGHTPEVKPVDAGWRIGIDTGACYGGMLTAVVLEGTTRRFLSVKD